MPEFSIIVPVYKVEPYLCRCVDSIRSQTFTDYELILVDDGSPDRCGAICDDYAAKDSRIRVIHKENGGLSSARNAGLEIASGTYLYFLDSDDYVDDDLLETVLPYLKNGADMVAFQMQLFWENGENFDLRWENHGVHSLDTAEDRCGFIVRNLLNYSCGWEAWNRVFVREKVERFGLRFVDNRKIFGEDLCFTLCYCAHAEKIAILDYTPYHYLQRQTSIMAGQKGKINVNRYNELAKEALAFLKRFPDCDDMVKQFPVIFYMLIAPHIVSEYESSGLTALEYRQAARESIKDWPFFEKQLQAFLKTECGYQVGLSRLRHLEQISYMRFMLDGSWFLLRVRTKLLHWLEPVLKDRMC
ncbi:MAG: glycosyltransferase family 2 protein [Faecousia sp.]